DDLNPTDPDYAGTFAERVFDLSVLDPAMGSGHFLVAAVERLSRAVAAARREQAERLGPETLEGGRGVDWARRQVARRCVYGVDRNGMAVELATASLWLRAPDADRPVASLDRHLKRGDSLVGVGPGDADAPAGSRGARSARKAQRSRPPDDESADERRRRLTAAANVRTAERLGLDLPPDAVERANEAVESDTAREDVEETRWFEAVRSAAAERGFFHWRLAFPEVFHGADGSAAADACFDAVVGNPPYVRSRNLDADLKSYVRERYETAEGAFDLYVPFLELAGELGARVSVVVPNKWTTTRYARTLRARLLGDLGLREVLDASSLDAFPDADVYPVVATYEPGRDGEATETNSITVRRAEDPAALAGAPATPVPRSFVDSLGGRVIPVGLDPAFADLAADVVADCDRLGDHATFAEGVHTGNVREKLLTDGRGDGRRNGDDGTHRKVVGGAEVGRYRLDWGGRRVRYDDGLVDRESGEYADLRDPAVFEGEKLLVRDISDRPVGAYDGEGHYALNTLYSVRSRPESDLPLRYLLGVFNSAFVARYFRQVYGGTRVSGDYLRFKPTFAAEIPVPDPDPALVSPPDVAAAAGVERRIPDDPAAAVAALVQRRRELGDERAVLDLDLLDYLDADPVNADEADGAGNARTLGEVGIPADGVGDSILAATAADREGLRIGRVDVERGCACGQPGERVRADAVAGDGVCALAVSATARYKPESRGRSNTCTADTDRWGYVETDPVAALCVHGLGWRETALVEAFVPAAVERGGGFAGVRATATKTISPLDRLRALVLPSAAVVAEVGEHYLAVRERAVELDDAIAAVEDAVDEIVCRLYGLNEREIEVVR
ncbi:Eco57I restriction-modification methylase domain-containing protein, partial [Halorussus sp. GCM10023401]